MEDNQRPQEISESGRQYFGFLADVGITKHFGSLNATLELVELCHIGKGKYVLDVGCGVGVTPCYLAKHFGCRVVGVDITPKMIERSKERAQREGLEDAVEFRVADARALPFEAGEFDAVICESVIEFLEDKQRAVDELARVAKRGGYVGLEETTLLRPSPSDEFLDYLSGVAGIVGGMLTEEEWATHLRSAGLEEMVARSRQLDMGAEAKGRLKRYPPRDMLGSLWRIGRLYVTDPSSRGFLKRSLAGTKYVTRDMLEYMGYGVYVGRKKEVGGFRT